MPFYRHLQTAAGQADLRDRYRVLIAARRAHRALRTGGLRTVLADDAAGVLAYTRTLPDGSDAAVVVANRSPQDRSLRLDLAGVLAASTRLADPLRPGPPLSVGADGHLDVSAPAGSAVLLVTTTPAGAARAEPPTSPVSSPRPGWSRPR